MKMNASAVPEISIITPSLGEGEDWTSTARCLAEQDGCALEHRVVSGKVGEAADATPSGRNTVAAIRVDALNRGIRESHGEIIGCLSGDDAFHSGALSAVCDYFRQHPDVDVLLGQANCVDEHGDCLDRGANKRSLQRELFHQASLCRPPVFFRRRVVDRFGVLDRHVRLVPEFEFLLRLYFGGARFERLPGAVVDYRIHDDNRADRDPGRLQLARLERAAAKIIGAMGERVPAEVLLRYGVAVALALGHDRESSARFDRFVLSSALRLARQTAPAGLGRWTTAARVMGRYLLREGVRMIGRPYFAMRFLPSGPRSWLQHGLRRKIFRLHHYAPRPVAVGSAYLPRVPEDKLPTISIVTPSYNQVDYLEETLQSVLNQQYPHLEYLVRDGGSTDGSREVLQRYDQQLTDWHSGPDGGQAQAVNDGLRQSRGEIMAYLNSDDLLLPGSLAYVADYFAQHPEVDVVYGHRVLINETGSEIGRWVLPAHDNETLAWVDYVPQETMFWRRRAWEAVGSTIDESFQFALDWDLILRFRAAGLRFVRLPRFLGAFRVTDTQKTSQLIDTIGRVEMNRLRREHLGRVPSRRELRRAMRPYLRRHWLLDKLYLLGAVQFE